VSVHWRGGAAGAHAAEGGARSAARPLGSQAGASPRSAVPDARAARPRTSHGAGCTRRCSTPARRKVRTIPAVPGAGVRAPPAVACPRCIRRRGRRRSATRRAACAGVRRARLRRRLPGRHRRRRSAAAAALGARHGAAEAEAAALARARGVRARPSSARGGTRTRRWARVCRQLCSGLVDGRGLHARRAARAVPTRHDDDTLMHRLGGLRRAHPPSHQKDASLLRPRNGRTPSGPGCCAAQRCRAAVCRSGWHADPSRTRPSRSCVLPPVWPRRLASAAVNPDVPPPMVLNNRQAFLF
jgi:hypothetical protein